ncbi:MAG: hypothetical protein J6D18_00260 [Erysipelotrichaceae bacterium]|nr:hypothetical protein [Erysipelotrichaceae bacterium]
MQNNKAKYPTFFRILCIVNGVLVFIGTIVTGIFTALAVSLSESQSLHLDEIEALVGSLGVASFALMILVVLSLVISVVCAIGFLICWRNQEETDESEKKINLFLMIGNGIAAVLGLLCIHGLYGLFYFGSVCMRIAEDIDYFDFQFFELQMLVDRISTMDVPFLLMRLVIEGVLILVVYALIKEYKNQKRTAEPADQTELPQRPVLPNIPQLPELPDTKS